PARNSSRPSGGVAHRLPKGDGRQRAARQDREARASDQPGLWRHGVEDGQGSAEPVAGDDRAAQGRVARRPAELIAAVVTGAVGWAKSPAGASIVGNGAARFCPPSKPRLAPLPTYRLTASAVASPAPCGSAPPCASSGHCA